MVNRIPGLSGLRSRSQPAVGGADMSLPLAACRQELADAVDMREKRGWGQGGKMGNAGGCMGACCVYLCERVVCVVLFVCMYVYFVCKCCVCSELCACVLCICV